MRVAYVSLEEHGGMAHYAENLARAVQSRVLCDLWVLSERNSPKHRWGNVSVHHIAKARNKIRHRFLEKYNARFYRSVADKIIATKPDVVHITTTDVGTLGLIKRLRESTIPVVITLHDPTPHQETRTLWGRVYMGYHMAKVLPRIFAQISAVHVHSEAHKNVVQLSYGKIIGKKTYVAFHGSGITHAIQVGTSQPGELDLLDRRRPTILFFGRIEPYKGLPTLLSATRRLTQCGIETNLLVAGNGSTPALAAVANEINVVVINRFIRDDEVKTLFDVASLVVLPYRAATQSGVIPLAYAFGRPVIATAVGAIPEIVVEGETGYLVPPDDPERLAEAIAKTLRDSKHLSYMNRRAFEYSATTLSWDAIAAQHVRQYEKLYYPGR